MKHPTIAIIGSGAVGGYYGSRLAQHGHNVHFLLRSDFHAVCSRGWNIKSCDGDFHLPPESVHAHNRPDTMPPADLVIITLKATSNDQLPSLVGPILKKDTVLVTLQNGLGNEEALAQYFGDTRVLGGLAFTCINRTGPAEIHHLDHGLIRIGEFRGGKSDRADSIAAIFQESGIACEVLDSLLFGRWEKLVWNVPFNGLGAALDLSTDRLIFSQHGRNLIAELMREVIFIAATQGVFLPEEIIQTKIEQTRSMGTYYTSMQLDRRLNRPMEIESIIGRPLGIATEAGVSVPQLRQLWKILGVWDVTLSPSPGR